MGWMLHRIEEAFRAGYAAGRALVPDSCAVAWQAFVEAEMRNAPPSHPSLPWRPISDLTPTLDGAAVFVASGRRMLYARFAYGWQLDDDAVSDQPVWTSMDDHIALDPQPSHYLPLSLPETAPPG